ncbi:MAG TPA: hypothetical protein VGO11_07950, partial [Chthoniobacteraceae bacterium]|nr:hypothetical protein [Chthoniobacteraceae bacterium]
FEGDPFVLVAWSDNHGGSIRWEAIDNKTGRVLFFDGKGERMNMSAYFRKFFFVAFETADQK